MTFAGRVAVVTGASTGFGRGIAVALARQGARVVVTDLREAPAEGNYDEAPELSTVDLIQSLGGEARFQACDVSRAAQVQAAVDTAAEAFGRLDILVNNAGVYRGGPFHELTEADLDACLDVIVRGTWLGCHAAIRRFLSQGGGGSIINIVSTAGLRGHPGQAPYNTAKGAQANLTRALAVEYARRGIRINGVCPTYMKTAMSRAAADSPEFDEMIRRTVPGGGWGEVADVVAATLFLLSDEARFLQGVLLPVDAGETAGAAPLS